MCAASDVDGVHSLPNVRRHSTHEKDQRYLNSQSLSYIKIHADIDYHLKPSPFNLHWIHGYNARAGVINLNRQGSTTAFYAAGNCGVLFNWTTNQMKILQGHRHLVKFIAADRQGRWLVTADSGPENILIIWDSTDYFPQKTLFHPHRETRLSKVALSADAKYLLTVGYQDYMITIFWWIWSFGLDEPHAKLNIELPRDSIVMMEFNPYNTEQFVLMTKNDIWIGVSGKVFVTERGLLKETDDYHLKIRKPEKKVNSDVGRFTSFTFVEDTAQVLVATSRGNVLVYGYTIEYREDVVCDNYEDLRFVKILKIEKQRINVITSVDGFIVTGNTAGEVRFYDKHMKLMYWVHGFTVDNVKGLSFNISPRSFKIFDPICGKLCPCWEKVVMEVDEVTGRPRQKLMKQQIPSDATADGKPIVVRDFIICTQNQGVAFVDYVVEKYITILNNKPSHALSLAVHPEKPFVCISYADGGIELFNFVQHQLFVRLDLCDHYKVVVPPKDDSIQGNCEVTVPELAATCLKYSPSGLHLACGMNTGQLVFLDPTTIDIITEPFQDSRHSIKLINFSCDSLTMVYADSAKTVGVYKYNCQTFRWNFVGKHRSHYKGVTAAFFLPEKNTNGEYKLLSLGADRIMVEYDIGESSEEYLNILSLDRVEQTAVPITSVNWPPSKGLDPELCHTHLPTILIATDEYKYKIINYATTMTLSTVLGPRYEHPVSRLHLISRRDGDEEIQYLLFATKNVIGLQKLPLDGNPWKHVGLLGHPLEIIEMCFRDDSGTLFTIGSKDSCMYQWAANYRSVETTTKLGGGDLDPYYCLIENGRPGWLFGEIRDLFYYIQILCQGTFSPAVRRVKDYIPIDSLPDLMRALGFFPTEYEVENLIVEAKYKVYQKQPSSELDFEEFVKLYLNHRPAHGDNSKRLQAAYRTFASYNNANYVMTRNEFLDMLTENGECFPRFLSWYLLSILSGQSFEDRANMTEEDFSFLPEEISFSDLVTNIIGIHNIDNLSEQFSGIESLGSQLTCSSAGVGSEDK